METFLEAYNKHILSSLEYIAKIVRKHRSVSISTAIALATVSYVYYKLTTPPKHMRHIPKGDSIKLLRAIASGWTATEIAKKIQIPAAMQAEHGLYTMVDHEGWAVHIQDPNAAKKFLLKIDLFPKEEVKQLRPGTVIGNFFLEPNITTVIGDQWRAHRKIANPAFHRSMPIHLFAELSHKLMRVMDKIDPTVDFIDLTTRFTLDALGLAGFDFNFNAIEDPESEWVIKYHSFSKHMFNPLYILFPILERKFLWLLPHRKKVHQDLDDFRNMLDRVIVNKRRILQEEQNAFSDKKESEKDLLTLMIESENEGEGSLSNDELKGNLSVFFLAGHDTTALSLAYAVYYMAVNPEVQRKAREEAISIFGDGPEDVFPTLDELRSLKYINCIIKETLRMNNPAPTIMPRRATEDTDLNGVFLQKGTRLVLDIHGIHHNPRFWKDPETFNPDRYLEGNEYDNLSSTLSWLAFSNGARQCIGMNFSLAEQRILLPLLLRKYEWTLPEDSIHKNGLKASAIGLSVVKDLKITFKRRH